MDSLHAEHSLTRRSFVARLLGIVAGGSAASAVVAWAWPHLVSGGARELHGFKDGGPLYQEARYALGTIVEVTVDYPERNQARRAAREALAEVARVDRLLSIFRSDSEISRLNREAARWSLQVDEEVLRLLALAQGIWEQTAGAFDPTVYALMDGWGWYRSRRTPPTPEEVVEMLELVGFDKVAIDQRRGRVRIHQPGVRLDLGGIGKGYAMDCAIAVLRRAGIKRALINAGGEIYALGDEDSSAPFPIAVFTPSQGARIDEPFPLLGAAVASSGNYERSLQLEGLTVGHLFNPRSGYPATEVEGVSVLAPTAAAADAYSTAVFVLGREAGARLIDESPDLEGLIVGLPKERDGVIWSSRNWPA